MSTPIDPELLLREEAWLRRLALQLVGDAHLSDDLLQETWLAALEHPPRIGADESGLRRWLNRVLRNRALLSKRGHSRRKGLEREGASAATTPDVSETVARAEIQHELMAAVLALPPQQKDVVLLRYFEGLPAREIARRLNVSGATVRSRLSRGLSALRTRLDESHDGGRGAWSMTFALHFMPSREGALLTTLLMKTQTKAVLLSLFAIGSLVTLAGVLTQEREGDVLEPDPLVQLGAPAAGEETGAQEPLAPASHEQGTDRAPANAAAVVRTEEASLLAIYGHVLNVESRPVADILVHFEKQEGNAYRFDGTRAGNATRTAADGSFELSVLPEWGRFVVDDPERVALLDERIRAEAPNRDLEIYVAPRCDYAGVIEDVLDRPISGVRLTLRIDLTSSVLSRLRPGVERQSTPMWSLSTGEDGAFQFDDVPWVDKLALRLRRAGYEDLELELPAQTDREMRVVLQRPASDLDQLRGRVVDAESNPIEGAWIYHGQAREVSDAQGRFMVPRDEASAQILALKRGFMPCEETLELEHPADLVLTLDGKPLTIHVRIVDGAGEPIEGAEVWTEDGKPLPSGASYRRGHYEDLIGNGGHARASDKNGDVLLNGLLPGSYTLHAIEARTLEVVTIEAQAGEDITIQIAGVEAGRRVAGRILSLSGDPIPHAWLLPGRNHVGPSKALRTPLITSSNLQADQDGHFEIERMCTQGAFFYIHGEGLDSVRYELDETMDLAQLEIRLPLECKLQVLLEQDPEEADSLRVLDAQGSTIRISIHLGATGGGVSQMTSGDVARLKEGASEVLHVNELAHTLLLLKEGKELRRVPLKLTPGQTQVLRL